MKGNSVKLFDSVGSFAENKDAAADIRLKRVIPAIQAGNEICLDFTGITLCTQSFIHALIAEAIRMRGERALELMVFKGCKPSIRGIIETVIQYVMESKDD